jgi:type I restriction enzyme R subunit
MFPPPPSKAKIWSDLGGSTGSINGSYAGLSSRKRTAKTTRSANQRKLGAFCDTQSSGKSLSIVMFAEKVLRLDGSYAFVIVPARTELSDQIAGQFKSQVR